MKTGRPTTPITLSEPERAEFLSRIAKHKGPADSRIRAEIILGCAQGESGTTIA